MALPSQLTHWWMDAATRSKADSHITHNSSSVHNLHLALTYGTCAWHFNLAPSTWHLHLAPTPGSCTWHHHRAAAPGTSTWQLHLASPPGSCTWHLHLAAAPGTSTWQLRLAPPPGSCTWHLHLAAQHTTPAMPLNAQAAHRSSPATPAPEPSASAWPCGWIQERAQAAGAGTASS